MENIKKVFWNKKRKNGLFVALMLAVPLANFAIFWLYVNFKSILMAFQDYNGVTEYFTLHHFVTFFAQITNVESNLFGALINTLKAFVINNFIFFPLCVLFSYILFKKVYMHRIFRTVFFLPSIVSAVVLTTMFKYFIMAYSPLYALLVDVFGMNPSSFPMLLADSKYAFTTVMLFDTWAGIGYLIIILSGAIYRIPQQIFESAKLDGVTIFREFFSIVLPLIWPTLSTYIIFRIAGIFTYTGSTMLLTDGKYNTYTIGFFIFSEVKYLQSYYYPAAIGFIFTLIGLPIILTAKHFLTKFSQVEF